MKKNNVLRIAAVLAILVLLTTSVVSGTFAKYVSSGSSTDTARVAKWGVTITANGTTFAKEYATDNTGVSGTIAKSVISTANVVAPGTAGALASSALSGTPEVAVAVTYAADLALTGWEVSSAYYCPIVITVGTTAINGLAYDSSDEFEEAVENAIAAYSKNYAPGTNLASKTGDALAVTWSWAFSSSVANDEKDTALGNLASAPTIELEITTTVTQID